MYKLIADYTTISVSGSTAQKVSSLASQAKRLTNDGWTTLGSVTAESDGVLYQVLKPTNRTTSSCLISWAGLSLALLATTARTSHAQ